MDAALARGFGAAIIVPAIASTLKQAQREAAEDLHLLADYYHRASARPAALGPLPLVRAEACAAQHFGVVLVEQGINGATFFAAAQIGVMVAGPLGGMMAQLGITGNTIVTPHQTQKFNPAKLLFDRLERRPDWVSHLSPEMVGRFALASGRFAAACGYGREASESVCHSNRLRFA